MRRLEANGIDFALEEAGPPDGPLALCLHGFPDLPATWDGLLPRLADAGFHAVAPYLRGYAPSSPAPDGSYHVADLALDALALADALAGDADAVLVGHDWGAAATWTAAAHRPERFRRVVAMAVPPAVVLAPQMFRAEIIRSAWYQWFFQMPIAEAVVPMDDFHLIDLLWEDWSPTRAPDPGHLRAVKDCLATEGVLAAALGYYRSTFGTGWAPADEEVAAAQAAFAAPVTVPALFLQGELDALYPAEIVDEDTLRSAVPRVEYRPVADAGHFLHLERPDTVLPTIVDFLTTTP